jgi:hypothetical protein
MLDLGHPVAGSPIDELVAGRERHDVLARDGE